MDCSDFRKTISRALDGEIRADEHVLLLRHLEVCSGCRRFRDELAELVSLHRQIAQCEPPEHLVRSVLMAAGCARRRRTTWWRRIALSGAAALIIVSGIYAGTYLAEAYVSAPGDDQMDVLELEHLEEYPPGSIGDLLASAMEGGSDE